MIRSSRRVREPAHNAVEEQARRIAAIGTGISNAAHPDICNKFVDKLKIGHSAQTSRVPRSTKGRRRSPETMVPMLTTAVRM